MTKEAIISAIDTKIAGSDPEIWRIGITNDPEAEERYWSGTVMKKTFFWVHWQADSLADARFIASHYVLWKGMKNKQEVTSLKESPVFVYLF